MNSESSETHAVHLHALAAGGDAVGRLDDGRVVFAALGAPDEDVTLRLTEENARFTRGEILDVTRAASTRIAPPCEFYPRIGARESGCGGCQIQHLESGAQREIKRRFVVDALQRIGKFEGEIEAKVAPCRASPDAFFYRNKAEFAVASTRNENAPQIGFRARGSHRVVDVARCLIQDELTNLILTALRAELRENPAPIVERVVVRVASGEALLVLETSRGAWPQERDFAARLRRAVPPIVGVMRRVAGRAARLIEDGAAPRDWLEERIAGLKLRVTADGFFQVNAAAAEILIEQVRRLAQVENGTRVLDLYCGAGLFALALAQNGADVTGIESGHQAIRDARRNAKLNGLRADFFADDAARALQKIARFGDEKTSSAALRDASTRRAENPARASQSAKPFDLIVLDPPRAGAADCLPSITKLRPARLVYVSCDAATLARDARVLASGGYELREVVPVDLFPQTAHVECVALFREKIR